VLDPVELDLGALVADLEPMLRQLVPAGIALCLETAPDVPPVHADRAQLEQVVVNLVANARDALAGGGTIAVRVEADELDDGAADAAGVAPGAYVRLVVADTGPGVDPAVLGTLFEPFVSTKEAGHGTGLGLATVHGIVVQSGGAVRVLSEPGRGATFFVHLPVARHAAPAPAPAAAAPAPAPPAPRGHERVLVCEDEAAVRRLLEIVLTGHGYAVRTAAHPGEALALLEAGTPLDLLVSDVVMPGMSGLELASRVRAQRPGVPVLFLSGYTASEFDGELPQRSGFMEKPFEPGALLTSVRTLLDEGPGEGRGARHRFRGRGAPRRQESRAP
jgi:CheY-like chemotaxis protein